MIYSNGRLYMLNALIEKVKGLNFSIQTQYKFFKINKVVQNELDIYEQQRADLVKKYAEYDENGKLIVSEDGGVKIKKECIDECVEKINELNVIQCQFPDIYFSLDELEPLNLTMTELEVLEPFIKE